MFGASADSWRWLSTFSWAVGFGFIVLGPLVVVATARGMPWLILLNTWTLSRGKILKSAC